MFDRFCTRGKWFLAIVTGALGIFTAAQAGYAQGGTWTPLANVSPSATEGMAVGGVGQVIVGAYGFSPSPVPGNTNQTRLYNINTDSWSTGAPAPLPARAEAAYGDTTHGGFLYVIGGGDSGVPLPNLERYDPVLDAWTTLAPMNAARAGAAAAVIDDGIFVIGGRQSTKPGAQLRNCQPRAPTWRRWRTEARYSSSGDAAVRASRARSICTTRRRTLGRPPD